MTRSRSWYPWRRLLRHLARRHGFLDPLTLYARLQGFGQPAEVAEPIELIRAGAVFHARGLVNSRTIQHNLDWVWPYWIERQFDPSDPSFLPRAFSLTHVNLTHRNWTAIGLPGREALPIVDPRGLLTPFWDGWSLDVWIVDESGVELLPSRLGTVQQGQRHDGDVLRIETISERGGLRLANEASMIETPAGDVCRLALRGEASHAAWLVVSLRPCNPEGVSFIDHVRLDDARRRWIVDGRSAVLFDQPVERHHASRYRDADVHIHLFDRAHERACGCSIGLVTAAAMFRIEPGIARSLHVDVPLEEPSLDQPRSSWRSIVDVRSHRLSARRKRSIQAAVADVTPPRDNGSHAPLRSSDCADRPLVSDDNWTTALAGAAAFEVPDTDHVRLYESALRTLVLCTPGNVYAGPYTYKRYWYRDAVFIGHALLLAGLTRRARQLIRRFPERQTRTGYYHSQEGEWDANGQVLWLTERVQRFTGARVDPSLWASLKAGADWIVAKRLPDYGGQAFEGLLPAGFSAEHLGPIDHYFWDNAWGVAGLECAATMAVQMGDEKRQDHYDEQARALRAAIARSLSRWPGASNGPAIPAAPSRRLDAGAIGSLVFSYPLQLFEPDDARVRGTVKYVLEHCFHEGGFFQDMIHSGVNAYLTLHVAQTLLRAGDRRHAVLTEHVAALASPTGHWPEAVHPHTGGGCMGDGHHAWAAAEWIAIMRNAFIREEGEVVHVGSGLLPAWLRDTHRSSADGRARVLCAFGPAPTAFGPMRVEISAQRDESGSCRVSWSAEWHGSAPTLLIALPGHEPIRVESADAKGSGSVISRRSPSCTY